MTDFHLLRDGKPECPSDLLLDRVHTGEQIDAHFAEHIEKCAVCTERMQAREAGWHASVDAQRLFERAHRAIPPSVEARERRPARGMVAIACFASVAAALFLWLRVPSPDPYYVRGKGTAVLHVFRQTTGGSEELVSGASVRPGDRLRFAVDAASAGYVTILGREASRKVYRAWPLNADAGAWQDAGTAIELSGAVELDQSLGSETLYLVHCSGARSSCTPTTEGLHCPDDCGQTAFVLKKESR
jgi:hypothetical protein